MDDLKKGAREVVDDAKKAWRGRDGEDLGDKLANAGDDIRRTAANAGDDLRHAKRDAEHDADYGKDPLDDRTTFDR
ncbi:MAG: hypothetical protein U0838_05350 [Chloroflexota bacterium]